MDQDTKKEVLDAPWIAFDEQSEWDAVLHLGHKVSWPRKSTVRSPGDEAKSIFLIRSGVLKVAAGSRDGLLRTLWLMGPGSVLGEAAMFSDKPYHHHITVVEACEAYEFSKKVVMEEILAHHPELSRRLLVNLASKSYVTSTQVEDSAFLTVPQRLGRFLYGLCLARHSLQLPLSHAAIAELLGIHRVTVSNTISMFKKAGLLDETAHGISITDINAIAAFINDGHPSIHH